MEVKSVEATEEETQELADSFAEYFRSLCDILDEEDDNEENQM